MARCWMAHQIGEWLTKLNGSLLNGSLNWMAHCLMAHQIGEWLTKLNCSPIFVFCVATSQFWFFWATPLVWTAIKSENCIVFIECVSTAVIELTNSLLLQVLRCIQSFHRQNLKTLPEILFISAGSEETLLLDLNSRIKNSPMCKK